MLTGPSAPPWDCASSGGQVAAPQPAAFQAKSVPSDEPAYTTPFATLGAVGVPVMVAVQSGLGWLITDARYQGARTDLIVGTMIVIGLIGWGIDLLLRRLESHPRVSWGYPQRG